MSKGSRQRRRADRYMRRLQGFLNDPAVVEQLVNAKQTVDVPRVIAQLYEAFDIPGFTTADVEWLRSIGVSPE